MLKNILGENGWSRWSSRWMKSHSVEYILLIIPALMLLISCSFPTRSENTNSKFVHIRIYACISLSHIAALQKGFEKSPKSYMSAEVCTIYRSFIWELFYILKDDMYMQVHVETVHI